VNRQAVAARLPRSTACGAGGDPRLPVLVVHPGAELYGADRVLLESAVALSSRFDVTVALPGAGPLVGELERRGLRVVRCRMPVLRNAALRPRGALRLLADAVLGFLPALRLLRRRAAGGVYVNTLTLPSWPVLARLAGRRSLCHVHEAEQSAPRLLRRTMALCPVLADRVVANSRFTLDVLADVAPRLRARSSVIYNPVHGPAEALPPRRRLEGPLRLLYIGRLSPRKGPQVALEALRELVSRGMDARLQLLGSVFTGYEWFEAELHRLTAEWELTDRVEFLGFRPDIWPHLADTDVVLVPSIGDESFGNTAVEAVLAARPLVVSDSSGLREAAAGYTSAQAVDPGRALDWADAIERVAGDWATFRQAAAVDAARARDRHTAEGYQDRLVEVMAALTRNRANGSAVRRSSGASTTG
jgi:glycosyltransferase involved in cell wall biosynthesis